MARLGQARVFAAQGEKIKARTSYQTEWKEADPDIPSCSRPRRSTRSCNSWLPGNISPLIARNGSS